MRTDGLPNFPDPTFTSHEIGIDLGSIDPQSPTFKRAAAACHTP
jgi:hypothetical protein